MYENAFFSLERFVKLIKQEWVMNRQRLLIGLAVALMGGVAYMTFRLSVHPNSFEQITFDEWNNPSVRLAASGYFRDFLAFMIALVMVLGLSFYWQTKHQRLRFVMVPASTFEKYLSAFLIRFVGGFILTLLLFWVCTNLGRLAVELTPRYQAVATTGFAFEPFGYRLFINPAYGMGNHLWRTLFTLFSIGAFFFVVPLFFKKLALLKTSLLFFVVLVGFLLLLVGLSHLFFPEAKGFEVLLVSFRISPNVHALELLLNIIEFSAFPVLLLIGYFKLKERTV